MDLRLHKATKRIAHRSLDGQTNLPLTDGQTQAVSAPLTDLLAAPGGARERQLSLGEAFCVIDREQGHAFGFAEKDGYCGWLTDAALADPFAPTHWIATPGTHLYDGPKVQHRALMALSLGARVQVTGDAGGWAQTPLGFVPMAHLLPIRQHHKDPVRVAEGFLHVPYLWGGNSRAGIDCSGLVQLCHLACGIEALGDADLQQAMGTAIGDNTPLRRGDLLFWSGHVAIVVDDTRLIHANGHTMSVAYENTDACIARILAQNGGSVTERRRL